MPRPARLPLLLIVLLLAAAREPQAQSNAIRGFPSDAAGAERQREEQFRKVPDAARLKEYMSVMAGEPHVAGRPASRKVAEYALEKFKSWGLDARIESLPWMSDVAYPRVPFSTRNPRMAPSSARAHTTATSAMVPFVIQVFSPFRTQLFPSRRAVVFIPAGFDPYPGSVRPKQPIASPA